VLLFGHADPIGEPVVAHGPFVMNTREEIQQAARDYMDGKFGPGLE
jgi:redox-sensitive bicupin YhaK (pirin superfamily)